MKLVTGVAQPGADILTTRMTVGEYNNMSTAVLVNYVLRCNNNGH